VGSFGLTTSSALNMQPCDATNVLLRVTAGVGAEANDTVLNWLKPKIGPQNLKKTDFERQIGGNGDIYKKDDHYPHVDMCNPSK
jgi:hypothetical protein